MANVLLRRRRQTERLTGKCSTAPIVASNSSVEAALEPVKLSEHVGKASCNVGSRFAV
jgi:hypothetical protein